MFLYGGNMIRYDTHIAVAMFQDSNQYTCNEHCILLRNKGPKQNYLFIKRNLIYVNSSQFEEKLETV